MKASHILWCIFGWMFLLLLGSLHFLSGIWATCSLRNRKPEHSISHGPGLRRRAPKELTGLRCFGLWSASHISVNEPQWGLRQPTPDLTEVSGTCTESFQAALPFISMKLEFGPVYLSCSIYPLPSIDILKHFLAIHLQTDKSIAVFCSCVLCPLSFFSFVTQAEKTPGKICHSEVVMPCFVLFMIQICFFERLNSKISFSRGTG